MAGLRPRPRSFLREALGYRRIPWGIQVGQGDGSEAEEAAAISRRTTPDRRRYGDLRGERARRGRRGHERAFAADPVPALGLGAVDADRVGAPRAHRLGALGAVRSLG